MNRLSISVLCAALLCGSLQAAPDENSTTDLDELGTITITPDRVSEPLRDTTADVTVITAEEIQKRGYRSLSEALADLTGFATASNGGEGQISGLFLRGMNSGNILILLDGVPLKDPTDPSFSAGLAHLRLDAVDRIEVVKGAQSGLWGADAAAGVINIVTKRPDHGAHVAIRAEAGSHAARGMGIDLSAAGAAGSFLFSADHYRTHSISAYAPSGAESDHYRNDTYHFRGSLRAGPDLTATVFAHRIEGNFDYDSGFPSIDPNDPDSEGKFQEHIEGLELLYDDGTFRVEGMLSNNTIDRHMDDSAWGAMDFHGNGQRATLHASWNIDRSQRIGLGIDYNRYEGSNTYSPEASYDNRGFYGDYRYIFDDLLGARTILSAAIRRDDFSTFSGKTTYRLGIKRQSNFLPGLYCAANYATAYRAPSLYQYSTNHALKPESTRSLELILGYEDLVKVTYFRNRIEDRFDYDFATWSYFNSPASYTLDGIEIEGGYRFTSIGLDIHAGWTHMFSLTDDAGNPILRVPRNEGTLRVTYHITPDATVSAGVRYLSKRIDYGNFTLGAYTLVDLSYRQHFGEHLDLSLGVRNLLDRDYETAHGYSSPGRTLYGRVEYRF